MKPTSDVIDTILGVVAGDPIARLRGEKPERATQLQAYYDAIFTPDAESTSALAPATRCLVAVRVASHTRSRAVADWYAAEAARHGAAADQIAIARESGRPWTGDPALAAAIRHAELLTTTPSRARQADLQALEEAGLTPAGIVSLSQVIAFVSYQLRLIAGLRAFGGVK
jgi:uncharacterized protein YciW